MKTPKVNVMQHLVELFYNWYSKQVRHPKYRWLVVIGTLLYLFSPIDLSADFLPIIGWIDDGIVLTLLTTELSRLLIEQRQDQQTVEHNQDVKTVEAEVVG